MTTQDETERLIAKLQVPDAFMEWVRGLPERARERLSIHDLRQIWEPMRDLQAELAVMRQRSYCRVKVVNGLRQHRDELKARIAELESELSAIKAQASDSTEYVLAQVNRELRAELTTARNALFSESLRSETRIAALESFVRAYLTEEGAAMEGTSLVKYANEVLGEALPNG